MQCMRGEADRQRLEVLVQRGVRTGLCAADDTTTVSDLVESSDHTHSRRILSNPHHVLHPLLADHRKLAYNLRKRNYRN